MKIIALSDQHGHFPDVPECDLLIVAGDNCIDFFGGVPANVDPERQKHWFETKWLAWRLRQPAKHCVVTWGNHDFCGQRCDWRGREWAHERNPERVLAAACGATEADMARVRTAADAGAMGLVVSLNATTTLVCDALFEYEGLRVWLSPWSNRFMDWAFMHSNATLEKIYSVIPEGIDILVSHQPPKWCRDSFRVGGDRLGSEALEAAIRRVRPRAVVCGHIHGGHGVGRMLLQSQESIDAGLIDGGYTMVYNVAVVNEAYDLVHRPTPLTIFDESAASGDGMGAAAALGE